MILVAWQILKWYAAFTSGLDPASSTVPDVYCASLICSFFVYKHSLASGSNIVFTLIVSHGAY